MYTCRSPNDVTAEKISMQIPTVGYAALPEPYPSSKSLCENDIMDYSNWHANRGGVHQYSYRKTFKFKSIYTYHSRYPHA